MKTKTFTVFINKDSLGDSYGLEFLRSKFGNYVIDWQVYDHFHSFELPCTKKVKLILTDILLSLSLTVDIYHDSKQIVSLMKDLVHGLNRSLLG